MSYAYSISVQYSSEFAKFAPSEQSLLVSCTELDLQALLRVLDASPGVVAFTVAAVVTAPMPHKSFKLSRRDLGVINGTIGKMQ